MLDEVTGPVWPWTELTSWTCKTCGRLWVARTSGATIYAVAGTNHFAVRRRSWNMCNGVPVRVDRPDVMAAFALGGAEAVDEMGPELPEDDLAHAMGRLKAALIKVKAP